MNLVLTLFLTGIVLLAADLFVAGLALAILGAGAMLAATALAYRDFGMVAAVVAGGAATVLLGLTVYLELVWLPKTRFGRGLVVQSTVSATSQPPPAVAAEVVGRAAEAATTLAPSGVVVVEGRRYEAFCQSGHAVKGAALQVVGVDNFRLIVTKS
jgi:membrane-bound ClpP family serine protease